MAIQTTVPQDTPEDPTPNGIQELAQTVDVCADEIWTYLLACGQAPRNDIRAHCASLGFPTDLYQKAMVRLADQFSLITEIVGELGGKFFQAKRQYSGQRASDLIKLIEGTKGEKRKREVYTDYYVVAGNFRLSGHALGSRPVLGRAAREFLRTEDGRIQMQSIYYAKTVENACGMPGALTGR